MRSWFLVPAFLCSLFVFTQRAAAQALADQVPDDAIVYVSWSGAKNQGAEFNASRLKAVLDSTDASKIIDEFLPKLVEKLGQAGPDATKFGGAFTAIAEPMWKHPVAFYFGGVQLSGREPIPRVAVYCAAGADAPNLVAKIKDLLADAGPMPVKVEVTEAAGIVRLAIGPVPAAGGKLTDSPAFKAALAKVHNKPVALAYVNGEKLMALVNDAVTQAPDREFSTRWPAIRQATGLDGFKAAIWTAAFENRNWTGRAYLAAPAPRVGVLKFFESRAMPDDALKVIPETALMAGIVSFDFSKAFDTVREIIQTLDADVTRQFDQEMTEINTKLGLNLRDDLLATLGDSWAYYVDPMTGGSGVLGIAAVSKLKDAAKAEQSLSQLEKAFNSFMIETIPDKSVTVAIKQQTVDGLTVHYLALPFVTPSWAIKDGHWIGGLYPQVITGAARNVGGGGKSILDNPSFVELRKNLGDVPVSSIQFADLPQLAPHAYGSWLVMSRSVGLADLFGVESPLVLLPPMYKLQPQLTAAGAATWTTDEGFFYRHVSPFPGSEMISQDPFSLSGFLQTGGMWSMFGVLGETRHHAVGHVDVHPEHAPPDAAPAPMEQP